MNYGRGVPVAASSVALPSGARPLSSRFGLSRPSLMVRRAGTSVTEAYSSLVIGVDISQAREAFCSAVGAQRLG